MEWIPIEDKEAPWLFQDDEPIVYLTINRKIMILKSPDEWHIKKYNITHYIILPKL